MWEICVLRGFSIELDFDCLVIKRNFVEKKGKLENYLARAKLKALDTLAGVSIRNPSNMIFFKYKLLNVNFEIK